MKTPNEIRCKLDALMDLAQKTDDNGNSEQVEQINCQIDALLWVIGDRSGASVIRAGLPLFIWGNH